MARTVFTATGKTGGTANDLDAQGSGEVVISAGDWALTIVDSVFSVYDCLSDGAVADGDSVIQPIASVLTAAGDANLRWHKRGSTGSGTTVSISETHSNFPNGLSDTELWRCQLQFGEVLTVNRLELQLSGGGTEATFSLEVVESTDGGITWAQLATVTAGGTPVTTAVSSTAAALVAVRVTNASGTSQDACLIASMGVA